MFFFFKQKTAYEMRISDWSSDVCSSDLQLYAERDQEAQRRELAMASTGLEVGAAPAQSITLEDGTPAPGAELPSVQGIDRSEEHTSELQSLMRISYAVFCLKKQLYYRN